MTVRDYAFQDRLVMSTGLAVNGTLESILLANIPGAEKVEKAQLSDDKQGTDAFVYRRDVKPVTVDVKVRERDPILAYGNDDLALEVWSVVEQGKCGWTLDARKQTDFILWVFKDTGRWTLVPFPLLCAVFNEHKEEWVGQYKVATQSSDGGKWHSQCVFVPRREIWAAIYRRFGGVAKG